MTAGLGMSDGEGEELGLLDVAACEQAGQGAPDGEIA